MRRIGEDDVAGRAYPRDFQDYAVQKLAVLCACVLWIYCKLLMKIWCTCLLNKNDCSMVRIRLASSHVYLDYYTAQLESTGISLLGIS